MNILGIDQESSTIVFQHYYCSGVLCWKKHHKAKYEKFKIREDAKYEVHFYAVSPNFMALTCGSSIGNIMTIEFTNVHN